MTRVSVLDVETTGLDPEKDEIVELAVVEIETDADSYSHGVVTWRSQLFRPTVPIGVEAMAAHHITDDMVAGKYPPIEKNIDKLLFGDVAAHAAHNAPFDRGFLPHVPDPWICTWRCAMHLWPKAPGHGNQTLRYYLGLDVSDMPEEAGAVPHRALYDTWCTAKLLLRMTHEWTCEELLRMTNEPVLLDTVRFGKHRGEKWADLPRGYLQWILRQGDFDEDVLHTARHHLG